MDGSRVDAFVTQYAEEAAVAIIDSIGEAPEIAEVVVSRASVDMVDGHALLYRSTPGDIDGTGCKDVLMTPPSITELKILCFTMFAVPVHSLCVNRHFTTVGIDAHANYPAFSAIDIEGIAVRMGVPSLVRDELHED